jgi:hypothetical protein
MLLQRHIVSAHLFVRVSLMWSRGTWTHALTPVKSHRWLFSQELTWICAPSLAAHVAIVLCLRLSRGSDHNILALIVTFNHDYPRCA